MKSLFKLLPTRQKALDQEGDGVTNIVADIDAIEVNPVAFKWNGKAHYLRPVSTKEYLKIAEIFVRMDNLNKNQSEYSVNDLVDVYSELISSLCNTITKKDVLSMTQVQVAAIIQLIIEHVTGRIDQKKSLPPLVKQTTKVS